jgi:hypothetical protein
MLRISLEEFEKDAAGSFKQARDTIDRLRSTDSFVDKFTEAIDDAEAEFTKGEKRQSFEKITGVLRSLETAETSIRSLPAAWKLLWIEFGYLVALLVSGYLIHKYPGNPLWKDFVTLSLKTVWFGALGGTTIAIYGIYNHIQKRDFDPQYTIWYICKPVIGGIFGWFVNLIYVLGFVAIQGHGTDQIKTPQIAYLIGFLAGFSERFTIKMIDKLMAVLTTFEEKPAESDAKNSGGKKKKTP